MPFWKPFQLIFTVQYTQLNKSEAIGLVVRKRLWFAKVYSRCMAVESRHASIKSLSFSAMTAPWLSAHARLGTFVAKRTRNTIQAAVFKPPRFSCPLLLHSSSATPRNSACVGRDEIARLAMHGLQLLPEASLRHRRSHVIVHAHLHISTIHKSTRHVFPCFEKPKHVHLQANYLFLLVTAQQIKNRLLTSTSCWAILSVVPPRKIK